MASRAAHGNSARRVTPIHVHVENVRALPSVFEVTEECLADALEKNPWARAAARFTVGYDLEDFDLQMRSAEILIGSRFPREELARRAPRLRWIHTKGAGIDHLLPLDWLPPGLILTNNRGVHAQMAGEFGLMAVLMLNNNLPKHVSHQRQRRWKQIFATPVEGKVAAIVGVGSMGGAIARRLKTLGIRVLGVRRSGSGHADVDESYGPEELTVVLSRADFIVVTVPLTSETKGMIGRAEFEAMKPSAGLVNMARAGVVDYDALAEALESETIASALIDVFDEEPLPNTSPLWHVKNLLLTPHVSSDDAATYISRTLDLFLENLRRYLDGCELLHEVNLSRQY